MTESESKDSGILQEETGTEGKATAKASGKMTTSRRSGKRGRKPAKIDVKAKLERSRQSARECRARKKLRYQYLEELVSSREKAIFALRHELESLKKYTGELDAGTLPPDLPSILAEWLEEECGEEFTHSDQNM